MVCHALQFWPLWLHNPTHGPGKRQFVFGLLLYKNTMPH